MLNSKPRNSLTQLSSSNRCRNHRFASAPPPAALNVCAEDIGAIFRSLSCGILVKDIFDSISPASNLDTGLAKCFAIPLVEPSVVCKFTVNA